MASLACYSDIVDVLSYVWPEQVARNSRPMCWTWQVLVDEGAIGNPLAAASFSYFIVNVDHVLYWIILRSGGIGFSKTFASPGLYLHVGVPDRTLPQMSVLLRPTTMQAGPLGSVSLTSSVARLWRETSFPGIAA